MLVALVDPPASEPVTLQEAKGHLRLEHALDDDYVTTLITAARQWVEEVCWRGLVTQSWERTLSGFTGDDTADDEDGEWLVLPRGNLASVTSVTYVDGAGASQTLAGTEYQANSKSVPGRLQLAYGKTWPTTRDQWDAVVVRYVVGWAAGSVPKPLKQAILLLISQMYEQRTPEVVGATVSPVEFAVDALIGPYRLQRL